MPNSAITLVSCARFRPLRLRRCARLTISAATAAKEFACVLTDTSTEGAMITCEPIRASIAALRFPAMDPALGVTVSIGVADSGKVEVTGNAFRRADEALYLAKQNGRNRCVASPGNAPAGVAPAPRAERTLP